MENSKSSTNNDMKTLPKFYLNNSSDFLKETNLHRIGHRPWISNKRQTSVCSFHEKICLLMNLGGSYYASNAMGRKMVTHYFKVIIPQAERRLAAKQTIASWCCRSIPM